MAFLAIQLDYHSSVSLFASLFSLDETEREGESSRTLFINTEGIEFHRQEACPSGSPIRAHVDERKSSRLASFQYSSIIAIAAKIANWVIVDAAFVSRIIVCDISLNHLASLLQTFVFRLLRYGK